MKEVTNEGQIRTLSLSDSQRTISTHPQLVTSTPSEQRSRKKVSQKKKKKERKCLNSFISELTKTRIIVVTKVLTCFNKSQVLFYIFQI